MSLDIWWVISLVALSYILGLKTGYFIGSRPNLKEIKDGIY